VCYCSACPATAAPAAAPLLRPRQMAQQRCRWMYLAAQQLPLLVLFPLLPERRASAQPATAGPHILLSQHLAQPTLLCLLLLGNCSSCTTFCCCGYSAAAAKHSYQAWPAAPQLRSRMLLLLLLHTSAASAALTAPVCCCCCAPLPRPHLRSAFSLSCCCCCQACVTKCGQLSASLAQSLSTVLHLLLLPSMPTTKRPAVALTCAAPCCRAPCLCQRLRRLP
jgi:hypothetical protein